MQYIALLVSTMMAALAQFLFKLGMNTIDTADKDIGQIIKAGITNIYVWCGALGYIINLSLWIYVLSQLELSKAYPMTSLAYIFTLFLGLFFLNEQITPVKLFGILFVIVGVILLTR